MTTHSPENNAPEIVPEDNPGNASGNAVEIAPDVDSGAKGGTAAPTAADVPNGRQEALWAALTANPGASATVIGAATGMSRVTAGKILNRLETEGRARREPGGVDGQGRGRTPDRWYPIITDTVVTAEPDQDKDGFRTASDGTTAILVPPADKVISDDSIMAEELAETPIEARDVQETAAFLQSDIEVPDSITRQGIVAAPAPGVDSVPAPDQQSGEDDDDLDAASADEADPALEQARTDLLELAELFIGAATALGEDEEAVLALGRLEMAIARTPQVHRNARAVLTGTAPARSSGKSGGTVAGATVRHGALRDRVLEHLSEYPGKEFTPYEIGRALDSSSGAVANALDRLVSLGQAELTCERPRRFRLVSPSPTP
jgi:DNA-binding MarR family transcriptional regulator